MAAMWHNTADPAIFRFIQSAVDPCIAADGAIAGYKSDAHSLDNIEMGRAVLFLYRVTQDAKYARAAKFLHDQLALQPRTPSGGYWHKQIYPNQMWLDGAYMAEPFRAEYAATFQQPADFDDIARQLLLMDQHMRDPDSGLLKHGWDESKQMPWADKTTGLSPEVWGRAMGWYAMALVDVLDWFPASHPQRAALVAALNRTMAAVVKAQDAKTGLWWQVMTHDSEPGNYFEASASCMFAYALAKGVRIGLLPQADEENAKRAWAGIQKQFIVPGPEGTLILQSTVKVGGLGGTPYRAGDFDYYIHEPVVDQDKKGVGAFLLAGSEMEQSSTEALGQGKTALIDAWFNSQTRKTALGQTELYHYKWDDDSPSGYSLFGRAFQSYGVSLATLAAAPTPAALAKAQIYIIASPDIPIKNPTPHYMDQPSGDAIEAWVKARRRPPALLQRPRQHRVRPLQHIERPLRHPLQPRPLAPRRRRRPRLRRGRHSPRHRHLRRRLHRVHEGHLLDHRSQPGQGRRHRSRRHHDRHLACGQGSCSRGRRSLDIQRVRRRLQNAPVRRLRGRRGPRRLGRPPGKVSLSFSDSLIFEESLSFERTGLQSRRNRRIFIETLQAAEILRFA